MEESFNKPVEVIQVFSNILRYGKEDRSFEARKEQLEWWSAHSVNGHITEGKLFLPGHIREHPRLHNCDAIIIWDDVSFEPGYIFFKAPIDCLILNAPKRAGNFMIKKTTNSLEVHLEYDEAYIGIPHRQNMKLCELKKDVPVEIRVNGKTDFSLTGRRERNYKDQHYMFELLGTFDSFQTFGESQSPVIKKIPAPAKLVNLLKPLW